MLLAVLVVTDNEFQIVGAALIFVAFLCVSENEHLAVDAFVGHWEGHPACSSP